MEQNSQLEPNQMLNQTKPNFNIPIPQPTPQNKSKTPKTIIYLPIVLFLLIAGFFGYKTSQGNLIKQVQPTPLTLPTVKPQITPLPSPLPESEIPADWKTYKNEEYGFEFKYPSKWLYLETPTNIYQTTEEQIWLGKSVNPPSGTDAKTDISIIINKADPSSNWEEKYFNDYKSERYQLGDIQAKKISGINKESLNNELIVIASTGNFYLQILSNQSEESLKYFDQILATFKFLEQTQEKTVSDKGIVEGKICYPSEGIPAGTILAKNIKTGEITRQNFEGVPPSKKDIYSISLDPGTYVFAYDIGSINYLGFYSTCAIQLTECKTTESHQLIEVNVVAGKTISNVDLCDYYYQPDQKPNF